MGERVKNRLLIKHGLYSKAYDIFESIAGGYTFDSILDTFPKLSTKEYYCYLMYAISRDETPDKHMTLCQILMFMKPFIDDDYSIIYWHIKRVINLFPEYIDIKIWVLDVFWGCPTSPLSDEEFYDFAKVILEFYPNNEVAIEIVKK